MSIYKYSGMTNTYAAAVTCAIEIDGDDTHWRALIGVDDPRALLRKGAAEEAADRDNDIMRTKVCGFSDKIF